MSISVIGNTNGFKYEKIVENSVENNGLGWIDSTETLIDTMTISAESWASQRSTPGIRSCTFTTKESGLHYGDILRVTINNIPFICTVVNIDGPVAKIPGIANGDYQFYLKSNSNTPVINV